MCICFSFWINQHTVWHILGSFKKILIEWMKIFNNLGLGWLHHQFLLNQITIENINGKVLVRSISGIKTEQWRILTWIPIYLLKNASQLPNILNIAEKTGGAHPFDQVIYIAQVINNDYVWYMYIKSFMDYIYNLYMY